MSDPDPILNTDPDYRVTHVFSINDISGGFDGATVADTPSIIDLTADPKLVKDAPPLYPIDSEFGFEVTDFSGALEKVRDGEYTEGWAGNLADGSGLAVSDAPTDTFKTPAVLGTWLSGLGGNSVKASTEHYSVMQNVLSDQKFPDDPDAVYTLDDDLRLLDLHHTDPEDLTSPVTEGQLHDFYVQEMVQALDIAIADAEAGTPQTGLTLDFDRDGIDEVYDTGTTTAPGTDVEVAAVDIDQDGTWDIIDRGLNGYGGEAGIADILTPNESTILNNIAYGDDYSVTLKDDGKLLYRWGNMIKRPNDVRLEVEMPLPDEWDTPDPETGLLPLFRVTQAELATAHTITNNPNDQIRPEDFENEAAIGTLPSYTVIADYNEDGAGAREVWVSDSGYYAGDGTFYEAGTILRDDLLITQTDGSTLDQIGATSSDLEAGFTNAWYTTMDRAPFTADLNESGDYDIGPRWRLQTDKYGQDLPGVVIPIDPSVTANPTKDQVKYEVGADTLTVLNLLDWESTVSPLSLSAGYQNNAGDVSVNGLNMTSNFDVAFYIKGDIKPATLYNTELIMSYEELPIHGEGQTITGTADADYLVGMGGNTFTGDAGADLFVLSYGSTAGTVFNASTITDFDAAEDVIGLIGVGADDVALDTALLETNIGQEVVGGDLQISVDGNTIAVLEGVTDLLGAENFYSASQDITNEIFGTAGNDVLRGTIYSDVIWAGAGNDKVFGLAGDDTIGGGAGDDRLSGGDGDDTLYGGTGVDNIFGDDGDDSLYGGDGDDKLWGGDGADSIWGLDGNDTIGGGAGDDSILGGVGNDTIYGSAGADEISGEEGDDTLFGGADADTFTFETDFGTDTVGDFALGEDTLVFDDALWGGGKTATQVVDDFASVVGGDVVIDFGTASVTLLGVGTTTGLESDIVII